jgi:YidC/Oxa1 family membrane protein insertase
VRLSLLNPLYDIVAWLIMRIHAILAVPLGASSGWTWALTIVVLVVLMRLLLLPLFVKQMHSQRKMVALAPELSALRKRYKNDKQKLQEEMMKLYKENGANPLSGCLPLVAQLPVWYALLGVLEEITRWKASQGTPQYGLTTSVVHSALQAHIFGVSIADTFLHTSAVHVKIAVAITVLISAVTTFLSVRQSTKRGLMQSPTAADDNPMAGAQKYMVYIAPLFALSGLYWQYGLVVYWLTSNIWQLGQQHFLFKKIPPLTAVTSSSGTAAAGAAAQGSAARAKPGPAQVTAKRPGTAAKPGAGRTATARQPGAAARQPGAPARQPAATSARQPGAAAKRPAAPAAKRPAATSAGQPAPSAKQAAPKKPASAKSEAAALGIPPPTPNGSGGMLRKLVRGRAEPEQAPEPPEVTIVRQQRAKQSRSKRTGKR